MSTYILINRAGIEARAATDAVHAFPHLFAQQIGPAMVQPYHIHFFGAIGLSGFAWAGKYGIVDRELLPGTIGSQQWPEELQIIDRWQQFFNTHYSDLCRREGSGQAPVAFVLRYAYATYICQQKITTGNTYFCCYVFFTQVLAGYFCYFRWGEVGFGAQFFVKYFCYVLLAFVHGGGHYMVGRFAVQLLYIFAQVCFYRVYTIVGQEAVQVYLFRHHRLCLHHLLCILLPAYLQYGLQRFFTCLRPYYLTPARCEILFKLLQVSIQVFYCLPLYIFRFTAREVQIRELLLALYHTVIVLLYVERNFALMLQVVGLYITFGKKNGLLLGHRQSEKLSQKYR